MRLRTIIGLSAAVGGVAVLQRKVALKEDLDWATVEKPGEIAFIDGYGVHYVDRGHGPAIVLLHGFGGHTYSYRHLMPILEPDHRVIAVDLKGFGYSERDDETDLSGTAQVAMLRALLERCAIDRAVIVGHSMGGGVALRFAATHPHMVDALVLAASVTGEERMGARGRAPAALSRPALLRPALPLLGAFASSRLLSMLYYDKTKITADVRTEYLRPARITGSMDGLMKMMRDRASDRPLDDERVRAPILILAGAHDQVVPLRAAQRLRERLPQARIVVIDEAAHGLLEERPEECAREIDRFLREVGARQDAAVRRT